MWPIGGAFVDGDEAGSCVEGPSWHWEALYRLSRGWGSQGDIWERKYNGKSRSLSMKLEGSEQRSYMGSQMPTCTYLHHDVFIIILCHVRTEQTGP